MIESIFHNIGLTEYETRIYLALLDIGESTSGEIMKKANINSGRIYEILDSLQQKGFISMVKKNKVKYFSPVNPKRAYEYLEDKEKDFHRQKQDFKNILPELLSKISKQKNYVSVEVFTGIKGLKIAYAKETEIAKKSSTLYIMSVLGREVYPKELYDFFLYRQQPKRITTKMKIKKLLSENARKNRKSDHEPSAEIRYLPYTSTVAINVIENLSIIGIETENPIVITVESKEVADSFRKQFELLWKIAKK